MALIEVHNIKKRYNRRLVVDDVSFSVEQGDVIGFIGANGAGKSTLMGMIVTLVKPTFGSILYKENNIVKNPSAIRGSIGYVPQDIALYQELTGIDNLKYWARTYHIKKDRYKESLERVKDIIGLDDMSLKRKVVTYSGGMKRRLNIGIALLNNPEVIVMDEPTVGIDIISKQEILQVIKQLNNEGKTILYTAHDFEEIEQICNKLCIINEGKIVEFVDIKNIIGEEPSNINKLTQYYLQKFQGNKSIS